MPPWANFVDLLEVPLAKSYLSITAHFNPLLAASITTPHPFAPPPIISRSYEVSGF
jgi:hypothetical protein